VDTEVAVRCAYVRADGVARGVQVTQQDLANLERVRAEVRKSLRFLLRFPLPSRSVLTSPSSDLEMVFL